MLAFSPLPLLSSLSLQSHLLITIVSFSITYLDGAHLENAKTLKLLKLFAEAEVSDFSCHPHHLCKLPLPAHPASKSRQLTTLTPLSLEEQGRTLWLPTLGRWLTTESPLVSPWEIFLDEAVTSYQLIYHLSASISHKQKMWEPEAVLKLSATEEPAVTLELVETKFRENVCASSPEDRMEQMAY